MRSKDDRKKEAIFNATIKMINTYGLTNVSMSKIAKEAGVSQGLLYTYYENKEDMFQKIYLEVQECYLEACGTDADPNGDTKTEVRRICRNLLNYVSSHTDWFMFYEQSRTSPLVRDLRLDQTIMESSPVTAVFSNGVKAGKLKDYPVILLVAFCFYPIEQIYRETTRGNYMDSVEYDKVFDMCWDAIRK